MSCHISQLLHSLPILGIEIILWKTDALYSYVYSESRVVYVCMCIHTHECLVVGSYEGRLKKREKNDKKM